MDTVQASQINSEDAQKSYSRLKGRKETTHLLNYRLKILPKGWYFVLIYLPPYT